MGFGFSWPRLQLGIDASFYGPHRDIARSNFDRARSSFSPDGQVLESELSDVGLERASVSERGKPVTNLGLGLEYFIEPDLSIVGGIQSDFSGLHKRQDTPADEVLFRQKKDAVHVSLGTTTYGEAGRLLVGVRGHYAAGTALIADSSVPDPVFVALPQSECGLNLVVSGSLTFRAVQQAADKAKQAADKAIPGQKKGKQKGDKEEEE
jgi:hypothetical protein